MMLRKKLKKYKECFPMWYKFAQSSTTLPVLSLAKILQEILKLIKMLDSEKQVEYKNRLDSIQQQTSSKDRIESLQNLSNDLNKELTIENRDVFEYVKPIINNRTVGSFDKYDDFIDADKIFKQYLDAQGNLSILLNSMSGSNISEIAKFFIENAIDPKFDIAKKVIKKFPNEILKFTEVVDLLLNFYLYSKLEELKSVIERRQPLSSEDKLAIEFIKSKAILHSMKIGISLFAITNKNIFGKLLSSIPSLALDGVEELQKQMKVDQSIQQLINKPRQ